jgi:hypothetical protein
MIKILVLLNNQILISQIEEVGSELGEPDCKLITPFEVKRNKGVDIILEPWNSDIADQNTFMIHSDKILTILDPKKTILTKYQALIN